jgi:hypothetical protein
MRGMLWRAGANGNQLSDAPHPGGDASMCPPEAAATRPPGGVATVHAGSRAAQGAVPRHGTPEHGARHVCVVARRDAAGCGLRSHKAARDKGRERESERAQRESAQRETKSERERGERERARAESERAQRETKSEREREERESGSQTSGSLGLGAPWRGQLKGFGPEGTEGFKTLFERCVKRTPVR